LRGFWDIRQALISSLITSVIFYKIRLVIFLNNLHFKIIFDKSCSKAYYDIVIHDMWRYGCLIYVDAILTYICVKIKSLENNLENN